jgi:hypothetical protein
MQETQNILDKGTCGANGCPCQVAVRRGKGLVHCPVHNDPNPSFNVGERDGKVLVHCQAGCDQNTVIQSLRDSDLWPEAPEHDGFLPIPIRRDPPPRSLTISGEPIDVYQYRDEGGVLVAEKGRWEEGEHKTFRWRKPGGSWQDGIKPLTMAELPLWGAEQVSAQPGEPVWLCEGEKAVMACRARGLLAVTFAGGASSRDFGKALDILKDHPVNVWPDNDAPGREYAARVIAHLKTLGITVRTVTANVPEKGDAFDFFAAGGTVESLRQRALDKPLLEYLAEDALRVRLPNTVLGTVAITCSELAKSTRSLDAIVRVEVQGPPEREPLQVRLNIESMSQTTELRRTLDALFGVKDAGWAELLNRAFAMVRDGFLNHDPSMDAADIEAPESMVFHVGLVAPHGEPTVIFGDGSAGKTWLTYTMAISAASGESFLDLATMPGPWLIVDYETSSAPFARRIQRLAMAMGADRIPHKLLHYWPAKGTPLHDLVPALQKKIREAGIVGVIVDSAAVACGGEPENAEVALRYFRALSRLGVTTLTIAHIPKGSDGVRPFGSTFWHNAPRRTWFVERVERVDSDVIDIAMICRKVNDGRLPAPIGVSIVFDGLDGPVNVTRQDMRDVPEFASKRSLTDRLLESLATGAKPIHELAEMLGEKPDTIRKALAYYEGKQFRRINPDSAGGRGNQTFWGLIARDVKGDNSAAAIPF